MNTQHYKPLNYVLIILLILAPLRSVLASQLMACDMEETSAVVMAEAGDSMNHCEHLSHDMSIDMPQDKQLSDDSASHKNTVQVTSCCSDDSCKSNCHFAVSASLFIQNSEYLPMLFSTDVFETSVTTLLVRELSPPSRPPLSFYS